MDPLALRGSRTSSGFNDEAGTSTSRSTRTQKRPYYNEDSDEEGGGAKAKQPPQKRMAVPSAGGSFGSSVRATRHTNQMDTYSDDDDDHLLNRNVFDIGHSDDDSELSAGENNDDDGEEPSVSVSSRGRVRKITAKARGLFRD